MIYYVLNKKNTEEYIQAVTLGGDATFSEKICTSLKFETKEEAEGWRKGLYCSEYVDVVPIEIKVLKNSEETAVVDQDEKVRNSLTNAYQEINICHEIIVEQAKEIWQYKHANEPCSKE